MSWIRLDDRFSEHPKVLRLSDAALRVHIFALCYAARNDTDGHVPTPALSGLRARTRHVAELLAAGIWERNGAGDLIIHDYLDYNLSQKENAQRREQRQEAGRRGGIAKAKRRA